MAFDQIMEGRSIKLKRRFNMHKVQMRQLAIMYIQPEMILSVVQATMDDCLVLSITGTPPGSKCVAVNYSPERRAFALCIEHDSFEDVPMGQLLPEIIAQCHRYYT